MFKRLPKFGSIGVISDTVGEALPIGAWSDALNIRFTGVEMQKMLEPELFVDTGIANSVWMQTWADGLTTYIAVASGSGIFLYHNDGFNHSWENVSRDEGYNTDGYWSSFAWGDTCIFNNGVDAPQIYNPTLSKFEDLPEWGLKSTAEDILNNDEPSERVQASCVRLVPYKSFLVAVGVTESGLYQPNKVWWSNTTNLAGYAGAPNWDYETPASLSGQIVIDPEGGAIRTAVVLNEQLVIYTDAGATAMMNVGGSLVMQFRRLFNKGAAGLHCVAEVNNSHFCVSQDQIYQHDGSTVRLLAKDRVEEEFFKRIGKGGRYGTGDVDWAGLQVVKNPDRKEITINYGVPSFGSGDTGGSVCVPVSITAQPIDGNQGDPEETVTFAVVASGTEPITYQWFEDGSPMDGETAQTLVVPDTSLSSYYAVLNNPCGSAQSNVVEVVAGEVCVGVSIFVQPEFIDNGDGTTTATVTAGGTAPITYQWEQDNAGDGVYVEMGGETANSLTVSNDSVNQYRVVTTNACGTETSEPPVIPACVITIPNSDIPSTSIWDETDAELPIFYFDGVVGVDGDEIIAAPSGRKIIHSTDRGQTWSVYPDSLPDDPLFPDNDTYHLVPSKWVKSGATWFAHLRSRESNNANNGCVIGSTFDGSSWNIGPKLTGDISNGRYSVSNLIIDGGNAVLFGRPSTPNNAEVWKYGDQYGASPNPLQQFSIASNSNGIGGIANWTNGGYLGIVFQSGNNLFNTWSIDRSCTDGDRYVNYTWGSTTSARYADNSKGVAVFGNWMTTTDINSDGFAVLTTSTLYDSDIVTASRTAGGEAMIASKPNIWLAAGRGSGDFGRWTLEYSLETTPTSFTYPCNVILPDNHTSSGTNGTAWWIGPSGDGWWIGWYRKASDQKLRIFKFELETYTGSCQL